MNLGLMFRITGIALFAQLALGGLVTYGYLDTSVHIAWGVILGVLAVATLFFVLRTPGRPRQLVMLTAGIGIDILIQALIGFAAAGTGNGVISWIHFLNALAIYGMTLAATFMSMAAARIARAHPMATAS